MASSSKTAGAAHAYARALIELANDRQQALSVGDEMRAIGEVMQGNPTLVLFLRDPGVSESERLGLIERVFGGRASPLTLNTMKVMNEHGRMGLLQQIASEYQVLLDEQLGKIDVDVTVAQKLDAQGLEQVRQRVSAAMKKDAIVHQHVDEKIIGGMVLRIEDKLIDGSVRAQLEEMKKQLMASAPR